MPCSLISKLYSGIFSRLLELKKIINRQVELPGYCIYKWGWYVRLVNKVARGYVTGHVTMILQLLFLLGVSSVERVRCVVICSLVKNHLTRWEKGKENQLIDQCKKPLSLRKAEGKSRKIVWQIVNEIVDEKKPPNPVGTKEGKSKDEDDRLIDGRR